jgi:hypothetical protein
VNGGVADDHDPNQDWAPLVSGLLWILLVFGWMLVCRRGLERDLRWLAIAMGVLAAGHALRGVLAEVPLLSIVVGSVGFYGFGLGVLVWLNQSESVLVSVLAIALGTAGLFFGVPLLEAWLTPDLAG